MQYESNIPTYTYGRMTRRLRGFFSGDPVVAQQASRLVGKACKSKGFFLVVNHRDDTNLISNVHRYMDALIAHSRRLHKNAYQEYCHSMSTLSIWNMELLGMSLGLQKSHLKDFFEDNESIMRLNYYLPC
ncbi:hypothetical protein H5410_046883 [Solanum commersonii]|uniref:Uncharacterized protein n=1 Tax=Solanum commersonii TaxID=4109 RepID=A0A9J5XDG4_SOLCO|nr:hypothetical protein H5410_046883 [Solanum commersonii]